MAGVAGVNRGLTLRCSTVAETLWSDVTDAELGEQQLFSIFLPSIIAAAISLQHTISTI